VGLKQAWAQSRYTKRVDDWLDDCAGAAQRVERAQSALGGELKSDRFRPDGGERLCAQFNASLAETRRTRVTNFGSVSKRTGHDTRVRAGQARSSSYDELQVIDSGTVIITDRRVQFLGSRHSRELRWRALADNPEMARGALTFRASGRQRPLVIQFHKSGMPAVQFALELALAMFDGSEVSKLDELAAEFDRTLSSPPAVPAGIDPDSRVQRISSRHEALNQAGTQLEAVALAAPLVLPLGCFAHTPPEQVALAGAQIGLTTQLLAWPGESAELPESGPTAIPVPACTGVQLLGAAVSVIAATGDRSIAILEAARPARSVIASASPPEGVDILDEPGPTELVVYADTTQVSVISEDRRAAGAMVHHITCNSRVNPDVLQMLATKARMLKAISKSAQVLILEGAGEHLPDANEVSGYDELILVDTDTNAMQDMGEPASADETADTDVIDSVSVLVAATTVTDPARRISRYLTEHARTVRRYDMTAGTYPAVNAELIAATRVLSSRISFDQEEWFIERAADAPWHLVPIDADLSAADPCAIGGLYDHASALFAHFRNAAPSGVKAAKIYKVLHLMRPQLYPILDSRLARRYERPARSAAAAVNGCRTDLPPSKYAYWAAIRRDLLENATALSAIRTNLRANEGSANGAVVDRLTNLRLLDILTWADEDNDADRDSADE